jgi:hypothetical protein
MEATMAPPKPLTIEPVGGGGWRRVTRVTSDNVKTVYYWHEVLCKKLWVFPNADQIQAGKDAMKGLFRGGANKAGSRQLLQAAGIPRLSPRQPKDTREGRPRPATVGNLHPVVPLALPGLHLQLVSPRALAVRRGHLSTSARMSDAIRADTAVQQRIPHARQPIPRRERGALRTEAQRAAHIANAEGLRRMRMERQRREELRNYRAAFSLIDVDNSGSVEPFEVLKVIKKVGRKVNEERFWQVFRELDFDNSNSLEFPEFEMMMDTLAQRKGPNAGVSPVRAYPVAQQLTISKWRGNV